MAEPTLLDKMRDNAVQSVGRVGDLLACACEAQRGPGTAWSPSGFYQMFSAVLEHPCERDLCDDLDRVKNTVLYLDYCLKHPGDEWAQIGVGAVEEFWKKYSTLAYLP